MASEASSQVGAAAAARTWSLLRSLPGRRSEAQAILNGVFGDALNAQASPLTVPMALHTADGVPVEMDRDALRSVVRDPSHRVCLLVHGLMSTESVWRFGGDPAITYGSMLTASHGVTPLYLRYNTGRHISTNGRELARLLRRLTSAWPVTVRELDLIGHSMGGLVIRSACHYGRTTGAGRRVSLLRASWPSVVRRVVLLGVPNAGANLEVIANLASAALWSLPDPVSRTVAATLDLRSDGIKDLRWGAVVDEDWQERDPGSADRPEPSTLRFPRHARVLVVAGSLTDDPDNVVGRVLGDSLVTASSARRVTSGQERRPLGERLTMRTCGGVNHVALANHREVYEHIADWW